MPARRSSPLDKPVRQRIAVVIEKLADDPRPAGVKTLTGMPGVFRIRVADTYRILHTIDDGDLLVLVVDVRHRRDLPLTSVTASAGAPTGGRDGGFRDAGRPLR